MLGHTYCMHMIGKFSCTETLIIFEDLYLTAASRIEKINCLPVDVPTNQI